MKIEMTTPEKKSRRSRTAMFIAVFLLAGVHAVLAQSGREQLAKADRDYEKKDYESALKGFLEVLPADPDNAGILFKTGMCYFHTGQKTSAADHLQKAHARQPDISPEIDYYLGMALQETLQFSKALEHYARFRAANKKIAPIIDQKMRACVIGDSLMRLPPLADIQAFDPGINTRFSDFSPLMSADGNTLIFSSNRSSNDYRIKSASNWEDTFVVRREGGAWGAPRKIGPPVNTDYHDAAVSLSPDGSTLFIYYEEGAGNLSTSSFENGTWTRPVPLNNFINNPQYREASASVTADGTKLFFSSNRGGGKGGLDIYVSIMGANGQWGRPSNLGSVINTRGDEDCPFIHPDGKTLYFSSNGHHNLGSNDIFKSEWRDGKWTKPENLGYPVNAGGFEGFFSISADRRTGYYSSDRESGMGNADLYVVHFRDIAPSATTANASAGENTEMVDPGEAGTRLRGTVSDQRTSQPLAATVTLIDNKSNRVLRRASADAAGKFELLIPQDGNFGVITEKQGYLFHSLNFDPGESGGNREAETHILLARAEVGSMVVLKNVFFDTGDATFRNESFPELEKIKALLKDYPDLHVQINGHTDNVGPASVNEVLSLKRAQAVVDYLVKQGVAPDRLSARGFGSKRPLVSNDDEEDGRNINRRTEIEIIRGVK